MPNLYQYLEKSEPDCIDRLIGSVINKLFIPANWRADVRQQILLAWFESDYDPTRQHEEILSYAHRRAFFSASEWRRHVVLPVTLHRAGEAPDPLAVSYDAVATSTGVEPAAVDAMENMHNLQPTELVEFASAPELDAEAVASPSEWDEFTAHCIELPRPNRSKHRASHAHLIVLLCEGLSVEEISVVTGLTERSVYRRLATIKDENRYAV